MGGIGTRRKRGRKVQEQGSKTALEKWLKRGVKRVDGRN